MTRTASSDTPRPQYPAKTSLSPSRAGAASRPPASRSHANETSPVSPTTVPSAPDTARSCAPRASNRTVHRPPTSGYDCWLSTVMPSA